MIKQRKRILVLFLLAIVLLGSVACGKGNKAQETEKPSNDNNSTSAFGKTGIAFDAKITLIRYTTKLFAKKM